MAERQQQQIHDFFTSSFPDYKFPELDLEEDCGYFANVDTDTYWDVVLKNLTCGPASETEYREYTDAPLEDGGGDPRAAIRNLVFEYVDRGFKEEELAQRLPEYLERLYPNLKNLYWSQNYSYSESDDCPNALAQFLRHPKIAGLDFVGINDRQSDWDSAGFKEVEPLQKGKRVIVYGHMNMDPISEANGYRSELLYCNGGVSQDV